VTNADPASEVPLGQNSTDNRQGRYWKKRSQMQSEKNADKREHSKPAKAQKCNDRPF